MDQKSEKVDQSIRRALRIKLSLFILLTKILFISTYLKLKSFILYLLCALVSIQ